MVNSIVGGQVITELSNGKCPLVVGVILIAIISLIIALLGYRFVHHFERFSWMVMIILFCIVAGLGAKHFVNTPMGSGPPEAASVLSFGGAVFGFSVAWISLTADYNVNMSVDIPRWKVFFWTYLGLFLSLNLIEMLGISTLSFLQLLTIGAACMAATVNNPAWAAAYTSGSVGGLLGAVLAPVGGFGKFCLVLLALSIVANNIPNNYSVILSRKEKTYKIAWIIRSGHWKLGGKNPSIFVDSRRCHRIRYCGSCWQRSFLYHSRFLPSLHGILAYTFLRRHFRRTSHLPKTSI